MIAAMPMQRVHQLQIMAVDEYKINHPKFQESHTNPVP
jgi:hypothetical protein